MYSELNLTKVSRQELLERTGKLVAEERKITAQLLRHLQEVEHRRLHLELGFASMYEYLTKGHGFSEGAASRRIMAMRLVRDVPEVAKEIESGKLSLSTATQVGNFLRNERKAGKNYSREQKATLALQMIGKSSRECERELFQISPDSVPRREISQPVSATETEIKLIFDKALIDKIEKLRALLAHHGNLNYLQLVEFLVDDKLKHVDPLYKASKNKTRLTPDRTSAQAAEQNQAKTPTRRKNYRPYISVADRKEVWRRAESQCEYRDPKTGQRCTSRWALQIDHIEAIGLGGKHELKNFRLLCSQHNKLLAIKAYGSAKMSRYLRGA